MASRGLVHGPLTHSAVQLCVDMQRLFAPGSRWQMHWAVKVLPLIEDWRAATPNGRYSRVSSQRDPPGRSRNVGQLLSAVVGRHPGADGSGTARPDAFFTTHGPASHRAGQARLLAMDRGRTGSQAEDTVPPTRSSSQVERLMLRAGHGAGRDRPRVSGGPGAGCPFAVRRTRRTMLS